jgi:low affinity Fe/Cu permease
VGVFLVDKNFERQNLHDIIRDIMFSITFLSFFLIQKAVNKYTAALHIKMNELVSAHDKARNELVNIEEKTEEELQQIAEEFKNKK